MSNPTVANVIGFAGAFALGAVQSGFDLIADKALPGSFGYPSMRHNRGLLGGKFDHQEGPWHMWDPVNVDLTISNPPCSGFSTLSGADFRGANSPINDCVRAYIGYAARCNPQIVIFESVQGAFTTTSGRSMMTQLLTQLDVMTGETGKWRLYHVLHNALLLGNVQIRKRYFWVASRIPFGVNDITPQGELPVLQDCIGDLEDMVIITHLPNRYVARRHPLADSYATTTGVVDGHCTADTTATRRAELLMDAMEDVGLRWNNREDLSQTMKAYYNKMGCLPSCIKRSLPHMLERNWELGFNQPYRLAYNSHCRVMTGGALTENMHPANNRALTYREVLRIMGFPDAWELKDIVRNPSYGKIPTKWWGKGVPVESGRWITGCAKAAIEGIPFQLQGTQVSELEYIIDLTNTRPYSYGEIR